MVSRGTPARAAIGSMASICVPKMDAPMATGGVPRKARVQALPRLPARSMCRPRGAWCYSRQGRGQAESAPLRWAVLQRQKAGDRYQNWNVEVSVGALGRR